jgi:hypothetical protein
VGDNFHSADCGLRIGQTICTCGYVKPNTDKEVIAELKASLDLRDKLLNSLTNELGEARETIVMIRINEDYGTLSWSIANKYLASHPKNDVVLAGAKTESQKLDAEDRANEDMKFESEGR